MKKWLSLLLVMTMLCAGTIQAQDAGTGVLALGADLSSDQRATVLSEMGITEAEAASYETVTITNDMEHQYLDESLGSSVVGSHSLSSVLLIPQESGAGLTVETHNINYCTIAMYRNALLTAGVQDAKVIVAAPMPISGTAALIGAVKAYETYSGTTVSDEAINAATDELVLTGELSDELDSEQISDLIAYLKQQIAEKGLDDPGKLKEELEKADILVNGTLVGMKPHEDRSPITDKSVFRSDLIVCDVVYNPEETKLLREAKEAGCAKTIGGKGMLLWQGVAAYKLYTGLDMPVEEYKKYQAENQK